MSQPMFSPGAERPAPLHPIAWGLAFGLLAGLLLATATVLLVLRGGPDMGQHLSLLAAIMPGYAVSYRGALVGFVYAFVGGYAAGRVIGIVYNAATSRG